MTVKTELDSSWASWQAASLYNTWRTNNPNENAKLLAYRAGTQGRPALVTPFGKALVAETTAWILSGGLPPPPSGTLHLSWDTYEQVPAKFGALDRMATITLSSMPPGVSQVIRVTVNDTDATSATGDGTYALNRSDGQSEPWIVEGAETWESFWMLVPDGTDARYPGTWQHSVISAGWNTFYEYHEPAIAPRSTFLGAWGSDPPVWQMAIAGGSTSSPTDVWVRGPAIQRNTWLRHVYHWKWSRQNLGYVEGWINDVQWLGRSSPNVLYGSSNFTHPVADNLPNAWNVSGATRGGYFEIGHYRGPSRPDVETTYLAKVRIGDTLASVA